MVDNLFSPSPWTERTLKINVPRMARPLYCAESSEILSATLIVTADSQDQDGCWLSRCSISLLEEWCIHSNSSIGYTSHHTPVTPYNYPRSFTFLVLPISFPLKKRLILQHFLFSLRGLHSFLPPNLGVTIWKHIPCPLTQDILVEHQKVRPAGESEVDHSTGR